MPHILLFAVYCSANSCTRVAEPAAQAYCAVSHPAAAAAAHASPVCRQHQFADDFIYDESLDEDAAAAQDAADVWDPADFYFDDDPEDFDLEAELEEEELYTQPRRKGARRAYSSSSARQRNGSGRRGGGGADGGACCSGRAARAAPASGDLTHNYGREMPTEQADVCVVCGSAEGSLVTGHTGRGGNCTRQYHTGCLLLLHAAGIRSVVLGKAAQPPRKRGSASSSAASRGAGLSPAAIAAQAEALCDGLLGVLWQQGQQPGHGGQSAAVLAAVAAARETAGRVASGELAVNCPSHMCHGCRLNGKHEFMTWCCGCWVRVYHHRQCVPYGAEHVQVNGRDFILCPHCRAAGVPVPGSAAAVAAAAAAAAAERAAASNVAAAGAAGVNDPPAAHLPEQGASGDAAAVQQPAAVTAADAADMMQTDQQQGPSPPYTELKQQPQQSHSSVTLQPSESESAGVSAAAPAAVGAVEVVDLLDSSEPGDREAEGVIEVSSKSSSSSSSSSSGFRSSSSRHSPSSAAVRWHSKMQQLLVLMLLALRLVVLLSGLMMTLTICWMY
jgi:hypothetical protein